MQMGAEFGAGGVMTRQQACDRLGVSRHTLRRLVARGLIRAGSHVGGRAKVYDRASVEGYAATGIVEGPTTVPVPLKRKG